MDATVVGARQPRQWLLGTLFGLGTQVVFAFTVWRLFWFLRDWIEPGSGSWLLVDALLALQFVVVHSLLLLPSTRSRLTRQLPTELYGCFFCIATCIGLWLTFVGWRGSNVVLWQAHGPVAAVIRTAFYASWLALFYCLRLSGFGYQTGWTQLLYWLRRQPLPRRGLVMRGPYLWIRHPVYLSFLGLIWFTPRMTLDHGLLTGLWTIYVFVGSCLKDQRLAYYLKDTYREYASRVAGYPGMIVGPLAKWPRPVASTSNHQPGAQHPDSRRAA